jgi:hypothetical protein
VRRRKGGPKIVTTVSLFLERYTPAVRRLNGAGSTRAVAQRAARLMCDPVPDPDSLERRIRDAVAGRAAILDHRLADAFLLAVGEVSAGLPAFPLGADGARMMVAESGEELPEAEAEELAGRLHRFALGFLAASGYRASNGFVRFVPDEVLGVFGEDTEAAAA